MFKTISVVVPCYNEGDTIYSNLNRLHTYLQESRFESFELIAVNDGSKDRTLEELYRVKKSLPNLIVLDNDGNKGKGHSIKKGVLQGTGDLICFTDADLSTPPEEIGRAIDEMTNRKVEVVIGSRSIVGSDIRVSQPFYRLFMGKVFSFLANTIVPLGGIVDTQCGFKCFTHQSAKKVFALQTMERFSFDVEILYITILKGFSIYEMPVTWTNDETSTVNPIRDSLSMFKDLFVIRKRHYPFRKLKRKG